MASWTDGYWWSGDGLRLHYRDYGGAGAADSDRPPILCLPGLTRNARDFEGVAARLAADWRVICVDLRGRGDSAYSPDPMTYVPLTYLQDLEALFDALELRRIVLFGTSLGGLLTMLLAMRDSSRIAAALINDVGPTLDPRGIGRIRNYVGRSQSWPTWLHAARYFAQTQGEIFPRWKLEEWLSHAKRLCRLNTSGRIVFDYDMRIAEPFKIPGNEAGFDMWPALAALAGVPTLVVRGALSDILAEETVLRMQEQNPGIEVITIPAVGHAPTLEEPEAVEGIDRLLARVRAA